ncbi:uncharacterized protein [Montipora capricornis]|uniref:uncharacterized protein n=1 Tax=Montipora capricornis TaxID=246305 RepID=UPI0035F2142D
MKLFIIALAIACYVGKYQTSGIVSPEALNVTLAVFAGVPDPQWTITPNTLNYQEIQKLYKEAKNLGATYSLKQMPAHLGYKGFLVEEGDQDLVRVIVGPKTTPLQNLFLQSIPAEIKLPKKIKDKIAIVIKSGKVLPMNLNDVKENFTEPIAKRAPPNWEGATYTWSHNYAITKNNCYNYANDKVTNTLAQPGRGSGRELAAITNNEVREAARRDGLVLLPDAAGGGIPNISKNGPYHLVALVVDPGNDYHWYRLDSNGLWSHKPGRTRITNRDGALNLIPDPRLAVNGPGPFNYAFVCFMRTNKNTVNIR